METFSFGTPPGCRETQVFDISELENEGDFELDGVGVMTVTAGGLFEEICAVKPHLGASQVFAKALENDFVSAYALGVQVFAMDATDNDGDWC